MLITTAARRIAQRHNQACGGNLAGGKLVFGLDGTGGEWYNSEGAYGFGPDAVVVNVGWRRITDDTAQAILDAQAT